MKELLGHIPEKIVYIHAGPQEASFYSYLEIENKIETVIPSFIGDNASASQIKTGEKWAAKLGQYVYKDIRENEPFSEITIVNLEIRNNGGRAYKAIDADGYYFDIREDVIFDAMINKGIKKGGILSGDYLWGQIGSQMKLVRNNSELHKALIRGTKRKALSYLPNKELEAGGVYQDKAGKNYVYMGEVKTLFLPYDQPTEKLAELLYQKRILIYIGQLDLSQKLTFETTIVNHPLLASQFAFAQSHAFVQKIDQIELSKDIITKLRKVSLKKVLLDLKRDNEKSLRNHLSFHSGMSHMHEANEELPEKPEYLKLLPLS